MIDIRKIKDMDPECIDLCIAMNKIPGIQTIKSCCGHDKKNYIIYFIVQDIRYLSHLLEAMTAYSYCWFWLTKPYRWTTYVHLVNNKLQFCLVGPVGKEAYEWSKYAAKEIFSNFDIMRRIKPIKPEQAWHLTTTTDLREDSWMDKECIDLCIAMNKIPGIQTYESCCGHGKNPYNIYFLVQDLVYLPTLLKYLNKKYWTVQIRSSGEFPEFELNGPKGENAYKLSKEIADLISNDPDITKKYEIL